MIAFLCLLTSGAVRADLRTFRNLKGEEIMAGMISATDSRAELKRADGKLFSVPLNSLSEEDRAWIAEWRKTHRHFKVAVQASVKKANTREKPGDFEGKPVKGNDCWYVLDIKNKSGDPLAGLRVEYMIFAPGGAGQPGAADVPSMAAGKSGQAVTGKLFVEQAQTVIRSGNASAVQFSESSLAGIHAELFVDGNPAGTFVSGKVPEDAAARLPGLDDGPGGEVRDRPGVRAGR